MQTVHCENKIIFFSYMELDKDLMVYLVIKGYLTEHLQPFFIG